MDLRTAASTWAAPQARDHFLEHTPEYIAAKKAEGHGMRNLNDEAATWPRPDATNRTRGPETMAKCADFRMRNAGQKTVPLYLAEVAENWSSPKASDPEKAGPNMRGSKGDVPLPGQAANWESPSVAVTDGTRLTRGGDRSEELLLTGQAVELSNWAAPATRDHKGSSEGSITRQDGKSRADMLDYQAEQFFRPPSSPAPPIAGGSMSSTDGPNSNQPSVKRKLNPIFVEALMRWPTGLSGFERQEMAWTRWWQLMPSYLSALVSASEPDKQQMDLFA